MPFSRWRASGCWGLSCDAEGDDGARPVHITGKPNPGMIMHKIEELGLNPSECAMVGDRLYTDMEMAIRAGCVSVLVLSGEATLADLADSGKDVECCRRFRRSFTEVISWLD